MDYTIGQTDFLKVVSRQSSINFQLPLVLRLLTVITTEYLGYICLFRYRVCNYVLKADRSGSEFATKSYSKNLRLILNYEIQMFFYNLLSIIGSFPSCSVLKCSYKRKCFHYICQISHVEVTQLPAEKVCITSLYIPT